MAVLVEALSVVVRKKSIESKFKGGWAHFVASVPRDAFCSDEELACVRFLRPEEVGEFIGWLEEGGLVFVIHDHTIDIAVMDQFNGPTGPPNSTNWLEFSRLGTPGNRISACWLYEGNRWVDGIHSHTAHFKVHSPEGWSFPTSLSANAKFQALEDQ